MNYKFCTIPEREEALRGILSDIKQETLAEKLINRGFCEAPASTKYHGSYPGGLFDHSFNVAMQLVEFTKKNGLYWYKDLESPIIVGILHDLCKIDSYIVKTGFDFDDVNEENPEYQITYNENSKLIPGHSTKSAILAQGLYGNLTEEELFCILFHMGPYDTERWFEYDKAIKKYPNVLWTHHADKVVAKIMGV
jgi:hypothetical protein